MTFGEQNTEKESHDILNYAFENGINALDTAEAVSSSKLNLLHLLHLILFMKFKYLDWIGLVFYKENKITYHFGD
jgi:predicted aldo/keto reductase-like oxidoreductase